MRKIQSAVAIFVVAAAIADAQEPVNDFPELARERLNYTIGKWRSEAVFLGPSNEVTRTEVSVTDRRFVIDDRVVAIDGEIVETGRKFAAWEYFNTREQKYAITGINHDGAVFTMKGDLGERFIWQSEPRVAADGTSTTIRFEHVDITPDSFTAIGRVSNDGGRTWRVYVRQQMTRLSDEPDERR